MSESASDHRPTAIIYSDVYLEHDTGAGHPESPERYTAIVQALQKKTRTRLRVAVQPSP